MSTVLDVSVCLLLVGAAMTTLAVGIPAEGRHAADDATEPDADTTARRLATVTAGVSGPQQRTAHGTLADHLGRAAAINATLGSDPLTKRDYATAVAAETDKTTTRRITVTAYWEPYPDAPLRGSVTAGETPPSHADIAVARYAVQTGIGAPEPDANSFAAIARSLAMAYVEWRFPPERTRAALVDERTAPATADRYRTMARPVDADLEGALADANARQANDLLASALAERLTADLRKRYDSPQAAAAASSPNRAVIIVRRWET